MDLRGTGISRIERIMQVEHSGLGPHCCRVDFDLAIGSKIVREQGDIARFRFDTDHPAGAPAEGREREGPGMGADIQTDVIG